MRVMRLGGFCHEITAENVKNVAQRDQRGDTYIKLGSLLRCEGLYLRTIQIPIDRPFGYQC